VLLIAWGQSTWTRGNARLLLPTQAVNRYQQLALLLKGEQPRGLLPPTPRGYVATRVQELAGEHPKTGTM
jgi:hypothetical protein